MTTADQNLVNRETVHGHHIQELQWGGENGLDNGVLLIDTDHKMFTKWWSEVSGI